MKGNEQTRGGSGGDITDYYPLVCGLAGCRQTSLQKIFRKFVDNHGTVRITDDEIIVRLLKHAHNLVLREARIDQPTDPNPWLGSKTLRIELP